MKNKNKKEIDKNPNKYSNGGDILSVVGGLSPLLNLAVPGLGTAVGAAASIGGGMIKNKEQQKLAQQQDLLVNSSQYNNPSAFGYALGGNIANGAYAVTGGEGQKDGNALNYKGQDIRLDFGETLDTNKDRVMSDRIINPRTGKSFADDDKKLKTARSKSEDLNKDFGDIIGKNTIGVFSKMEDSLFAEQELNKQLQMSKSQPAAQGYAMGGKLNFDYNNLFNNDNGDPSFVPTEPISSQRITPNTIGYQAPGPIQSDNLTFFNLDGTKRTVDTRATPMLNSMSLPNAVFSQNKQPNVLTEVTSVLNRKSPLEDNKESNSLLGDLTTGEMIGAGSGLVSLGAKAIESFQPYKKQTALLNNAPIEKMQLDPVDALRKSNDNYLMGLNDGNNQTSSFNQRQTYAQSLFANKLKADNDVLQSYGTQNKQYAQQYNEQLSQRQRENNSSEFQTQQINEANRAGRERMRMGVYSDVATMGMNLANLANNKYTQDKTLNILKQLNPDVYKDVMNKMDEDLKKSKKQ